MSSLNIDLERNEMEKLDKFLVEKFPMIIVGVAVFWFSIVAYGLLNQ
jgi:hypothetical protein